MEDRTDAPWLRGHWIIEISPTGIAENLEPEDEIGQHPARPAPRQQGFTGT